jgi:hypothetical protein
MFPRPFAATKRGLLKLHLTFVMYVPCIFYSLLFRPNNALYTKDNGGFETEHQGRSGSNFSQNAAPSDAELPETFGGMC